MSGIAFTLDLEDHRPDDSAELRFPAVTDALLDDLDNWGVRGTVFVVGSVLDQAPDLVVRVAERGHELALHGATHDPLPEVGPERFRSVTADALGRLADLVQRPVLGYRAPIFSLVPASAWAPDILAELGVAYSSSVLPARNPLYGWPEAPRRPFRWASGLIELPSPVFGAGPVALPLLGGTYLRITPWLLVRRAAAGINDRADAWCYAHPYDFDADEPRWVVPEVGRVGSRLLWRGRRGMKDRVRRLVEGSTHTLADVAVTLGDDLPVFNSDQAAA